VAGGPLLSELAEGRARERLFGVHAGLAVLAGMLGSALGGLLPGFLAARFAFASEPAAAYRAVLALGFGLFFLSLFPVLALPRGQGGLGMSPRQLLSQRRFLAQLAVINGLIGLGAGLLLPFVNLFFKLRFSVPDPILGLIFSLNSLLIGLGNLLSPLLAQRMGRIRLVVLCQALSLPFFFLWGYASPLSLATLGYLVRTALMNLASPMFTVEVFERVPPQLRGGVSAVFMVFWNGGWALGSLASGYVQVRWGFAPLFPATALLYSLAIYHTAKALGGVRTRV
jgi:MFS family permease